MGMTGRGVLVGVSVGAGVEVGCCSLVGETVSVGATVILGVTVTTVGDGARVGVGVVGDTRQLLIPKPPAARQAARVTPAKVRRAAAPQSGGVGACSRASRISAAV